MNEKESQVSRVHETQGDREDFIWKHANNSSVSPPTMRPVTLLIFE